MFELITPLSYWMLSALWLGILCLYLLKLKGVASSGAVSVLLIILSIDAFRTLFESAYFGLYFNSMFGIFPKQIHDTLSQPSLIIIPKLVNVVAGVLVLYFLIKRLIPADLRRQEEWAKETTKARDKAENSNAILIATFESIPDGVVTTDINHQIISTNQGFASIFGYDIEDLKGKPIGTLFADEDDGSKQMKIHLNIATAEQSTPYEILFKRKDGKVFVGETRSNPIEHEDGSNFGYLQVIRDISERKEAELNLSNALSEKLAAFEGAADAIITFDFDGILIEINQAGETIFEQTRDFLIGKYVGDLFFPEDSDGIHRRGLNRLIKEKDQRLVGRHFEIDLARRSGEKFPAEISLIGNSEGKKYTAFIRDISEKKLAEEALRRSQKMEAVGMLTGGIAHDFNNILNISMGNLELLEKVIPENEEGLTRLSRVQKSLKRGAELTNQLLGFSRKEAQHKKIEDVNLILSDLTSIIEHSVPKNIDINYQLQDDIWPIRIDSGDFSDAIINLTVNAGHAMPTGGRLVIGTSNLEGVAEPKGKIRDYVVISLSDTGVGITKDKISKIFDPFFTTKTKGNGTGLGLSMVFGFAERSKGKIDVVSEVGVGTTFRIFLPKAENYAHPRKFSVLEGIRNELNGKAILIVDDQKDLLDLAENFLSDTNSKILKANSGEEALDILQSSKDISLVFSDVVMPDGINGIELATTIFSEYPGTKVCLTSGFVAQAETKFAEGNIVAKQLLERVLPKPYTRAGLVEFLTNEISSENLVYWSGDLETGVAAIDKDHMALVELVNRAYAIGMKGKDQEHCKIIEDLFNYAIEHLSREEAIMEDISYPFLAEHKTIHEKLRMDVLSFCRDCKSETAKCNSQSVARFVSSWLINHIQKEDMKIAQFIEEKATR